MSQEWTDQQRKIYEGLKNIGEEAAGYFKAALYFYYDPNFSNNVSFWSHAARELDSGLREILSPKLYSKNQAKISQEKPVASEGEFKDHGNTASILTALNVDKKDTLAKEWILISTKFSKFAHRTGIWKQPRNFDDFKHWWERYEKVLNKLVGSYYAMINRLDRLIGAELTKASIGTVLNLLKNQSYAGHFFREMRSLEWFNALNENGVFDIEKEKEFIFWFSLGYLEWVSLQIEKEPESKRKYAEEILNIIERNTVRLSEIPNSHYVWWYFVKILKNLPILVLHQEFQSKYDFNGWLLQWSNPQNKDFAISEIGTLLGKFLDTPEANKYAEIIIDVITQISPNDKSSPLGRESATLRWQPYWIMDAFKKYNEKINANCSLRIIYDIAGKLKRSLEYKQRDTYTYFEIEDKFYRLEAARIFTDDGNVAFKAGVFECSLKQFTEDQLEGVEAKDNIWKLHKIQPPKNELRKYSINALSRDEFVTAFKLGLPTEINWPDDFQVRLGFLFDNLFEDYSYVWFKSLGQDGHIHPSDAEEIFILILRDLLLAKTKTDPSQVSDLLKKFLTDEYPFPIFKRFVLFFIDQSWDNYGPLLTTFLEIKPNPLHESDYEVELHDVFINKQSIFDLEFNNRIKDSINNVPEFYVEKGSKAIAYWQHKWLSSLKDSSYFTELYRQVKQEAEPKDDKDYQPDRSSEWEPVVHKTPLLKEEILNRPVSDLVKYLKEFQGAGFWDGHFENKPNRQGLAEALQAAVKENPKKFTDEIELFNQEGLYRYVVAILNGLREAWNAGMPLDWTKVFNFCLAYIPLPSMMDEAMNVQGEDSGRFRGEYVWLIDSIVGLIEDGSRDDKRAFENSCFDKVEEIFNALMSFVKGEHQPDTQRSAINYAINTTLGKVIESYIIYSLHVIRLHQLPSNWGSKYERFFEKGIDPYIFLGRYILNLRHLDQKYVDNKIMSFAQGSLSDFQWSMFMEGYLCSAHLPSHLFSAMRDHYLKALAYRGFESKIDERLVEHIAIGYLYYGESLQKNNEDGQESLFFKMLEEAGDFDKRNRWLRVASYFWGGFERAARKDTDKEENGNLKAKILAFWAWTYERQDHIKGILGDMYGKFLGDMARLTILLDVINKESVQWLFLSAPYVEGQFTFLIEYFNKFEDAESLIWIGKIYLEILNHCTPIFQRNHIETLIDKIYKKGVWDDAQKICEIYGQRGENFLRRIWEENQKDLSLR